MDNEKWIRFFAIILYYNLLFMEKSKIIIIFGFLVDKNSSLITIILLILIRLSEMGAFFGNDIRIYF
jgi:hypothetical protein